MAGASSVTDTCCLEAMTRCSEIPKKVLKKSLKYLSNASKSKVGALNVTFFYVFWQKIFSSRITPRSQVCNVTKTISWNVYYFFVIWGTIFSIFKALWASRYRGRPLPPLLLSLALWKSFSIFYDFLVDKRVNFDFPYIRRHPYTHQPSKVDFAAPNIE